MGRLDGQVAIVTGSSKGIGKAIAIELALEGASVTINYKSDTAGAEETLAQIRATGGKAIAIAADVGSNEEAKTLVEKTIAEFGKLDILINNAGITRDKSFKNMNEQMWLEVINANLNSLYYCTHSALQYMLNQKHGHIVSISSVIGQAGGFGQVNYSATKAAILGFTRSLALETAKSGITVNAICPGFIATEMVAAVPEDRLDLIKARIPMGRLGKSEEVARAVVFLCADADYITGQEININGGIHMG
ncbi:MAG: 3-oxoacyl-ACP reductase FabG [Chloroflexi bacterium]|uniref:3-oxoacyl-ACP reductase FabG n=1 Tax=Candidatus Chlorohelix allophototropha TaxID=3003348 RepID=A0A8T7M8U5_9CHLR|nr:3-oxoacyl-ACP reductase FabG [Chloroflexota bacterium]WJW68481.1 3-oxoacyl-ACP reductase FabG [Chloroflexota bacterium L227-S17]